jgi:uncharacterized repeat protein (TIGR01451 family)
LADKKNESGGGAANKKDNNKITPGNKLAGNNKNSKNIAGSKPAKNKTLSEGNAGKNTSGKNVNDIKKDDSENGKGSAYNATSSSRLKRFFTNKIFITIIVFIVVLGALTPLLLKYYEDYLNNPNFEDPGINHISVSAAEASPGDEIRYEITIKNEGRKAVTDVFITSDIPEYSSLAEEEVEYLEDNRDGKIYFLIDRMEIGEEKILSYAVKIDKPLDDGTKIVNNSFNVDYKRELSEEVINKKFETDLCTTVTSKIDLSSSNYRITDENGEYLRMGDTIQAVFFIKNTGNMDAKEIRIENLIPENTTFIGDSFYSDSARLENKNGSIYFIIDEIPINKSIYINYALEVNQGLEDKTNLQFEPYITNGKKQFILEDQEWTVRSFPELSEFALYVTDENGGDVLTNDILKYSVTLVNSGDGSAHNLTIENPIPLNTGFIDTSLQSGQIFWNTGNASFGVNIPEIAPGESVTYYYRVRVNGGLSFGSKITNVVAMVMEEERMNSNSVTNTVITNFGYNVMVIGDSQVSRTNWVGHLQYLMEANYPYGDFGFLKYGVGGETIVMGHNRMLRNGYLGQSPYIFIINFGTNDAQGSGGSYRTAPETFRYYLSSMIDTVRTNTGALVVVMSTGPSTDEGHPNSNLNLFNSIMAQVCAAKGAIYVDVFNPMLQTGNPGQFLSDGLHYNGSGDQLVANIAFNTIKRYLNAYGTR